MEGVEFPCVNISFERAGHGRRPYPSFSAHISFYPATDWQASVFVTRGTGLANHIANMKLYFFGSNRRETREETGTGIIAFAIPDIGFVFRSAHQGTALDCEYQALLTLCQFTEANGDLFKGQKLEILGDSPAVVYAMGCLRPNPIGGQPFGPVVSSSARPEFAPERRFLARILAFKKKLGFSILWVPPAENRAADGAGSHPTLKDSALIEKLNTSFLEAFKPEKNREPGLSPL